MVYGVCHLLVRMHTASSRSRRLRELCGKRRCEMSEATAVESFGLLIQIFSGALGSAAPGSSPSASINVRHASCCSGVYWSLGISANRPTVGCACDTSVFLVCDLSCSGNAVVCFIGLSFLHLGELRTLPCNGNHCANVKLVNLGSLTSIRVASFRNVCEISELSSGIHSEGIEMRSAEGFVVSNCFFTESAIWVSTPLSNAVYQKGAF